MNIEEAKKKVRAEKPREGFLIVQINGDDKLILPHKQGIAFLEALHGAERYSNRWKDDSTRIIPLESEYLTVQSMSAQEYEDYKIAAVLNVPMREVRDAREANRPNNT